MQYINYIIMIKSTNKDQTSLVLKDDYNDELDFSSYSQNPNNVEYNEYGDRLPQPPILLNLSLGISFNRSLNNLPNTLKYLNTGYSFNQPINELPNLTHLSLNTEFTNYVDNISNSLEYLNTGYNFNNNVDNLPNKLVNLNFGSEFNKNINNLPVLLKYLSFGYGFNKSIKNIPLNIQQLIMSSIFDNDTSRIKELVNLINLTIGAFFNKELDFLPDNLKILNLKYTKLIKQIDTLPDTLDKIITKRTQKIIINEKYKDKIIIKKF